MLWLLRVQAALDIFSFARQGRQPEWSLCSRRTYFLMKDKDPFGRLANSILQLA